MVFVFLFLTYFTQYEKLQLHPCCCRWHYFVLFLWLSSVPLCICTTSSYPFICQWTFRLFPYLGYCEQCCNEHTGAGVSFKESFVWIYAQECHCWIIWQCYIQFSKVPPYCFPQWLYQFTFPPTVNEDSLFFHTLSSICYLQSY